MGRLLELPVPDFLAFLAPLWKSLYLPWGRFVPNFTLCAGREQFYQNPGFSSSTSRFYSYLSGFPQSVKVRKKSGIL